MQKSDSEIISGHYPFKKYFNNCIDLCKQRKLIAIIKNPKCSVNVYCGRFALSIGRICHPERNKFNLFGLRRISSQSFRVSSPSCSLWQCTHDFVADEGKKSSNVDSGNKSNFAIAEIYIAEKNYLL